MSRDQKVSHFVVIFSEYLFSTIVGNQFISFIIITSKHKTYPFLKTEKIIAFCLHSQARNA